MEDENADQDALAVSAAPLSSSFAASGNGMDGGFGGENMVQDFVRLHMMSILQPFAERVHELQAQVEQLAEDLASSHSAAEERGSRLQQTEQQLSALQEADAQAGERLERALAELASLKKEKSRLEGNHEMTKASVGKTKEMFAQISSSVEALQKSLADSDGRIGALERGLPEVEQRISGAVENRLDRQGRVCKELNEKQAEMHRTCQQAKAASESTGALVKELMSSNGQRLQQDLDGLAGLGERTSELEARLRGVDECLEKHSEAFKASDREIAHLRTWSGQVADLREAQARQTEAMAPLAQQASRLEKLEADFAQVLDNAVSDRKLQSNELSELEQRVQKNIADIVRWRDNQKAQCDTISSAGKRLEALEAGQGDLARRADDSESELQELAAWRQGAARLLDSHGSALDAARCDLSRAQERIDGTSTGLQGMRSEVHADRELLTKLSSRIEMCCTYFNGLGKGLQDTHRQIVSGESGLLPPKPSGTVLPAIPRGPRTPRTSMSPRKALA